MELKNLGKSNELKTHQEPNTLFVRMLDHKQQDKSKDAKEFRVKSITRYLKSTQNFRSIGLLSLDDFLELHSVVGANFTTEKECFELDWIETLIRMIEQRQEPAGKCFPVLNKLITITSQHPDMHKIVQSKHISKIIDCIIANEPEISSFKCLETCMKQYSGPSGIFKNKIYDHCISSVNSMDYELVEFSGKCLHLLQQTRGGSVAGSAHEKNWAEFHEKVLNTLDEVFELALETGEAVSTGKSERLKLPESNFNGNSKNVPVIYTQQERFVRFRNMCIILESGLTQAFPVAKTIQLNRIMNFIEKGISMNQLQINKKDGESTLPTVLHIEIQKCLLSLLQCVTVVVGRNIMVYSKDICDILWKCLKSTNIPLNELRVSDNSSLRCVIYAVLNTFLQTSPNNHFIYKNIENLLKEALTDITPTKSEVKLSLPSAKAKKANQIKKTLTGEVVDNCLALKQNLCAGSLEFLRNLLIFNGATMKPVLLKILQDKILAITFKFMAKRQTPNDLYDSTECRANMLELVYNLIIHPAILNVTPTSFGIEILRKFQNNEHDVGLQHRAMEMLRNVELILHNRKNPIHFPPDLRDFRDSWLFNEKIVKSFTRSESDVPTESESNVGSSTDVVMQIEDTQEKTVYELSDDDSDVEILEKEIMPSTSTAKRTVATKEEEVPKKVARISEEKEQKVNSNNGGDVEEDDDVVNSYLADFCDDIIAL